VPCQPPFAPERKQTSGAVVGFVGYVRDFNDGEEVLGHAAGILSMTEKTLQLIVWASQRALAAAGHRCVASGGSTGAWRADCFCRVSAAHQWLHAFNPVILLLIILYPRAVLERKRHGSGPQLG
jgi:molybdopterin synthase catalytic subunit